jgi:hypothetical protein
MMIVRQYLHQAQPSHGKHRPAIDQAILLVRPGLVQRQRGVEIGAGLGKDIDVGVVSQIVDQGRSLPASEAAGSGKPIQDLREHLIRRHQARCPESTAKRNDASVKRVVPIQQGYPIEGIGEQHLRRHRRLLRLFWVAIKVFINPGSAARRQFIEFFGGNIRRQSEDARQEGGHGRLQDNTAILDLGHQVSPWLDPGLAA